MKLEQIFYNKVEQAIIKTRELKEDPLEGHEERFKERLIKYHTLKKETSKNYTPHSSINYN